jgi:hypothetical protein
MNWTGTGMRAIGAMAKWNAEFEGRVVDGLLQPQRLDVTGGVQCLP